MLKVVYKCIEYGIKNLASIPPILLHQRLG
jgi:hypothetical protein